MRERSLRFHLVNNSLQPAEMSLEEGNGVASAPSVVSAVRVRPNRRNGPNANGSGIGFASVIVTSSEIRSEATRSN